VLDLADAAVSRDADVLTIINGSWGGSPARSSSSLRAPRRPAAGTRRRTRHSAARHPIPPRAIRSDECGCNTHHSGDKATLIVESLILGKIREEEENRAGCNECKDSLVEASLSMLRHDPGESHREANHPDQQRDNHLEKGFGSDPHEQP